ncbi:hypothetical protein [Stutzerimonas azotifigens]|uniref:Uncharacterized protein n=1 Tax=Stutzerimonas azotifigens TaxID=291995 RepID=A0ABR5YW92_9GAMM|nr:hypothetical protein [Stutzerimonas azotifigens]MBA1272225.1 hypothetical protein [Stutzerimonas azotifigens]
MKFLIIPLTAALLTSPAAFACTTDEANAKAQELGKRVNELTKSDPERAAKINAEIRELQLKRTANETGNECETYDQRMRDLEKAEDEADIPAS